MSSFRHPTTGEDYVDAAQKQLIDAGTLANNDRFDGACYLAGYVAECCLKCVLVQRLGVEKG